MSTPQQPDMERFLIFISTVILCATGAQARVGETEKQIEARYGKPVGRWADFLGEKKLYHARDYEVMVSYWNGRSGREDFSKRDNSEISKNEIDVFLRAQ